MSILPKYIVYDKLKDLELKDLFLMTFEEYVKSLSYIIEDPKLVKDSENTNKVSDELTLIEDPNVIPIDPKNIDEALDVLYIIDLAASQNENEYSGMRSSEYEEYLGNKIKKHDLVEWNDQCYIVTPIGDNLSSKRFSELPSESKLYYAEQQSLADIRVSIMNNIQSEIESSIMKAEKYATENELSFSLSTEYGMGGVFKNGKWYPSSMGC